MPAVASTPGNLLAAKALFQTGKTIREVAKELGISPYTAWALKRRDDIDPESVREATKSLVERQTVAASMAVDTVIERGLDHGFSEDRTVDLAKMASILLQSANNYALSTGTKDVMQSIMADYSVEPTHAVSRVTVTKSVTLEQATPQPVVINPLEND